MLIQDFNVEIMKLRDMFMYQYDYKYIIYVLRFVSFIQQMENVLHIQNSNHQTMDRAMDRDKVSFIKFIEIRYSYEDWCLITVKVLETKPGIRIEGTRDTEKNKIEKKRERWQVKEIEKTQFKNESINQAQPEHDHHHHHHWKLRHSLRFVYLIHHICVL